MILPEQKKVKDAAIANVAKHAMTNGQKKVKYYVVAKKILIGVAKNVLIGVAKNILIGVAIGGQLTFGIHSYQPLRGQGGFDFFATCFLLLC